MLAPEKAMELEETWTVYVRLWGRCEGCSRGLEASTLVHYIGPEEVRVGEAGFFHPQGADRAQSEIAIARCGCGHHHRSAPARERQGGALLNHDELLAELFVLAHEFGHSRSWREGQRTPAYEEAVLAFDEGLPLSDEQQKLILEEEERAWRYARQELDSLGFSEWARFDAIRRSGLDAYQQTFWPTAR
jgi:hypothetical protein